MSLISYWFPFLPFTFILTLPLLWAISPGYGGSETIVPVSILPLLHRLEWASVIATAELSSPFSGNKIQVSFAAHWCLLSSPPPALRSPWGEGLAIHKSIKFPPPLCWAQVGTKQIRVNLRIFAGSAEKDVLSLMVSEMVDLSLEPLMVIRSPCRECLLKIKSNQVKEIRWRETQITKDNPKHLDPPLLFQLWDPVRSS